MNPHPHRLAAPSHPAPIARSGGSRCGLLLRGLAFCAVALLVSTTCEEPQKIVANEEIPIDPLDPVQTLARAYQKRDIVLFESLLANDPATNAVYRFTFDPPTTGGDTQWGLDEEIRLHHRLLRPDSLPPGTEPVPPAEWVRSIDAVFTPNESFQERPDLLSADNGADGLLLPERWRAKDARYSIYLLFHSDETDYLVDGESNFVVIEDLTKSTDEPGKFLIYMWDDVCNLRAKPTPSAVTPKCLSRVKDAYR